jgi:hypothetical protein
LPNPRPNQNLNPADYGLLEALGLFHIKCHPILRYYITNEYGGADSIPKTFKTDPKFASSYYHVKKNIPKSDVNFAKSNLSKHRTWRRDGYPGLENLSKNTIEIITTRDDRYRDCWNLRSGSRRKD